MKTIKTRKSVKNIKVLDKSVSASKRMKDAYVRTKDKAEETQSSNHATPTEYASNTARNAARNAALDSIYYLKNPRKKAGENWNRAKGHFQEVKRHMPKTRSSAVVRDDALGVPSPNTAAKMQEAKAAVKDAKTALKQVKQAGRQTIREVKHDAAQSMKIMHGRVNHTGRGNLSVPVDNPINTIMEFSKTSFESKRKFRLSNLDTLQRKALKTSETKATAPVNKTADIGGNTIKDNVLRPSYTNAAPKGADKAAKSLQSSAKTIKSTKKDFKDTAKGTVKTAKKSVKTAEQSAKKAVKTAQQTAKAAQKTAKTANKTAKTAKRTAKIAAQTVKSSVKAVAAFVKATIAAVKGLVSAIVAGGWVAVLIVLIICMIALLVGSIFGIFFAGEPSENGKTINHIIAEIDTEYMNTIDGIINANTYDLLDMSGARASWKNVLTVYTVKTVTDPSNPMEVATIDDTKAALLRSVFWEMNAVSYTLDSYDVEVDILDGDGLPTGETYTVTTTVLRISVTHKTPDEMAVQYGFIAEQTAQLDELLKPEYHSLWNALLYGITTIGDGSMLSVAETQLGNIGGETYWSWYGFTEHVEWCATFVSWVAEQCGFIDAGIMPRFSGCMNGVNWFKDREQWQDNSYTPRPGDIIFFDWEGDGICDHVGIVESVTDGKVNTIEGNTSDSVARRSYDLGSVKIYGFGTPNYE